MSNRPGVLDDGRMLFAVAQHPTHGWMLTGPELVIGGFESRDSALDWLRAFLDDISRRNADIAQEREMDDARLEIERDEMLARLLEPKTKQ